MSTTTTLLSMLQLKFNIDHPSVEESYVYGYEAAKAGVEEDNNPFSPATREGELWAEGWWAGFYGEEPLFTLDDTHDAKTGAKPVDAANDHAFSDSMGSLFVKVLEITSVIGVAALVGYQVLDLVA